MWLITPVGFFSIVSKAEDSKTGMLTIRARAKDDLLALHQKYLPSLSEIQEGGGTDYPYRARASKSEVASAMSKLVGEIGYENFKNEVHACQGITRANIYGEVWDVLRDINTDASSGMQYSEHKAIPLKAGPKVHPRTDDKGKLVHLSSPSTPTAMGAWADASAVACVIPDGHMPLSVNGISMSSWSHHPQTNSEWEALAKSMLIKEPPYKLPMGMKAAAGALVREPDGRIWIVAPSNAFGGYKATFPKGTLDGISLQAGALKEVFEEAGLKIKLVRHLVDSKRSASYTRYYMAERLGGNPADMCWESQAVMLVPQKKLSSLVTSPYDEAILEILAPTPQ